MADERTVTFPIEAMSAPPFGVWHPIDGGLEVMFRSTDPIGMVHVRAQTPERTPMTDYRCDPCDETYVQPCTLHGPVYRRRESTVRARRWTGRNESEVRELTDRFEALDSPCDDDPEATAQLLASPHSTWVLMYDGDWVVESRDGGFQRMTDEAFVRDYEPVTT